LPNIETRKKGLFHPELSLHLFCNCNIFKKPRLIVSTTHSAYGFACYCSKCTARVGLDTRVISEPNFLLDAEMIRVLSVPVDTFQRALNYVPELLSVLALSPDLEVRLSAITAPNLCVDTINHMLTSMYSVLDVNPLQSSLRPTSSRILTFSLSRIRFREKSAEGTSKGISGKLESIILELWKLGIMPFISTKENYMVLTAFV
jgi:hypothetical protein